MNTTTTDDTASTTSEIVETTGLPADATEDQKTEYYANLESNNKQMYVRMKKAEGFELKDGKWVKPETTTTTKEVTTTKKDSDKALSQSDLIVLIKADIPEEDISEVTDYATLRGISVAEALKSPIVKGILAEKSENRAVENGTHTGASQRSTGRVSDETLLSNANKGVMPENDEDITRLIEIRRANKNK